MSSQRERAEWWQTAIRIALGCLLVALALDKFLHFSDLTHLLRVRFTLPTQLNAAVAYLLSVSEGAVGVLLLTGNAMGISMILLIILTALDAILLAHIVTVVCECETIRPFLGMATPREAITIHLCAALLLVVIAVVHRQKHSERLK